MDQHLCELFCDPSNYGDPFGPYEENYYTLRAYLFSDDVMPSEGK